MQNISNWQHRHQIVSLFDLKPHFHSTRLRLPCTTTSLPTSASFVTRVCRYTLRCKRILTSSRFKAVGDDFLEEEDPPPPDDEEEDEDLDTDPNNAVVVDEDDEDDDGTGIFRPGKGKVSLGDDDDEVDDDIVAGEDVLLDEEEDVDIESLIEGELFVPGDRRQKDSLELYMYGAADGGVEDSDEELVGQDKPAQLVTSLQPRPEHRYRLQELLLKSGYEEAAQVVGDAVVTGVNNNADRVVAGDLYVADGPTTEHRFKGAVAAIESGAVAVVTNDKLIGLPSTVPVAHVEDAAMAGQRIAAAFYDYPSRQMTTVGVVGSLGKTTTSWLIRGLMEEQGQLTGMLGTLEYAVAEERLDVEGDIWQPEVEDTTLERDSSTPFFIAPYEGKYVVEETMPDGLHCQKVLAGMAERGATSALVEPTVTALAEGRCRDVDIDVMVFTNVLKEQADEYEEGAEEYWRVLERAFQSMSNPDKQRAVVNIDELQAPEILKAASKVPVVTYSLGNRSADVWAEKIKYSVWETELLVRTPFGKLQIITSLLGRHNVLNTLAAVATGLALGVELRDIVAGIEAVEVIPGRCEIIDEGQAFPVIVDAANSPASLARLLDNVREAGPKQIWLLFGCEGNRHEEYRPYMGEVAHYKADWSFITNNNPRHQLPDEIINDICSGFPEELHRWQGGTFPYMMDFGRIPEHLRFSLGRFHWSFQTAIRKYIIEDRFFAIRCIIGMAQSKDVVVIAGKGAQDFQEYEDTEGNLIKGWFDDRVECRNALSLLGYLYSIRDLDRRELPWTRYPEEREDYPLRTGYVPSEFLELKAKMK